MERPKAHAQVGEAPISSDLYEIARSLQMAKLRDPAVEPSAAEAEAIQKELNNAREGKGYLELAQGYQVARWLMIHEVLWPGTSHPTEEDRALMNKAAQEYRNENNLYQLASLIHTSRFLGVELNYDPLPENMEQQLQEALAEIK